MGETDFHRDLLFDLIAAVRYRFRDDPAVYVSGNIFVYYEEGNPEMGVAPDFFVVRGVHNKQRRTYKVWEEKKAPDLIVELTSRKTRVEDRGNKRAIYEELGVKEYYIFDPEGPRSQPPLRGFRLKGASLEQVPGARGEEDTLVFPSDVLRLELHAARSSLRWVDPATGQPLPVLNEYIEMLKIEKARADAAEAENARLREELKRLREERRG